MLWKNCIFILHLLLFLYTFYIWDDFVFNWRGGFHCFHHNKRAACRCLPNKQGNRKFKTIYVQKSIFLQKNTWNKILTSSEYWSSFSFLLEFDCSYLCIIHSGRFMTQINKLYCLCPFNLGKACWHRQICNKLLLTFQIHFNRSS